MSTNIKSRMIFPLLFAVLLIIAFSSGNISRISGYGIFMAGIAISVRRSFITNLSGVLMLVAVSLGVLGWAYDFYDKYPSYDSIVHFVNSFLIAFAAMDVFRLHRREGIPGGLLPFFSISVAVMAGGIWEVFEWAVGNLVPNVYALDGIEDAVTDLVMDVAGGVLGAYLYVIKERKIFR